MSFIILISFFLFSSFHLISTGVVVDKFFFKRKFYEDNIFQYGIIGLFFIGFISLLINFFLPLNRTINNIILFVPVILHIVIIVNSKTNYFKLLKIIFLLSIISSIIIFLENPYTPDAGLYHFPYIKLLNDSKIILGITNLNFTLGQSSFFQNISATFNNSIFLESGINMPLAQIFSFTILSLLFSLKKNYKITPINLIIFLILFFIFIRLSRYSEFGNDGPAHLLYFLLLCEIIILINNKIFNNYNFYYVCLVAIFIFVIKPTMGLVFFLIFYLIYKFKFYSFYKLKSFYFFIFFLGIFFIKNILISGCILFPIKITCIEGISWYSSDITKHGNAERVHDQGEGWTKGYPDQPFPQKTFKEYNDGYYWIKIWSKNHGIVVLNKFTPVIICYLLIFLILIRKKDYKNELKKNSVSKDIFFLNLLNLLFSIVWFFNFPVLRYGLGYLGSVIILSTFMILNRFNFFEEILKKIKLLLLLVIIIIGLKNFIRISQNFDAEYNNYPWPKIYTDTSLKNIPDDQIQVLKNNEFYFYKPNQNSLCFYNSSPCTHFDSKMIKNNVIIQNKYGYKIYSIKD